jgi:hypothetical protein
MKPFPPRLHILLARDAPTAIVIRRGPSKTTCVIHWDRRKDTFRVGQWVRARIYERRCDLSPDGKWFIYFAMTGRWQSETKGSWTAISLAPYLKAVSLFAKGDCWNGGGLFTGKNRFWLNGFGYSTVREDQRLVLDRKFAPHDHYGNECSGVYYVRLQRDGWKLVRSDTRAFGDSYTMFEKPLTKGWVLRKIAHEQIGAPPGKGCYWDQHSLEHAPSGQRVSGKDWEWGDVDGDRLFWAVDGQLKSAHVGKSGLQDETLLHDFNGMKFEAIEAPY